MTTLGIAEQPCVLLEGVSWDTFERLLHELGENRATRLAYDQGTLEIMAPLSPHEGVKELLSDIANCLAKALRVDFAKMGSTTFKRADLGRGFEPDQCFYIHRYPAIRGKREPLDLAEDPAPDLVIEVDMTHRSLNKLPIYAALGVQEVWRYVQGEVLLYQCEGGEAQLVAASRVFLGLQAQNIQTFLHRRDTMIKPDWEDHITQWATEHIRLGELGASG
jgi:Uma2 family endonuclease